MVRSTAQKFLTGFTRKQKNTYAGKKLLGLVTNHGSGPGMSRYTLDPLQTTNYMSGGMSLSFCDIVNVAYIASVICPEMNYENTARAPFLQIQPTAFY